MENTSTLLNFQGWLLMLKLIMEGVKFDKIIAERADMQSDLKKKSYLNLLLNLYWTN